MLPNEVLTPEDRMAEIEEAAMLMATAVAGWPGVLETEIEAGEQRLAHLFNRMRDRHAALLVKEKLRERDSRPTTVTEDAEL